MTPLSLMSQDVVQSDLTAPLRLACSFSNEARLDLWRNAHTSVTLRMSTYHPIPNGTKVQTTPKSQHTLQLHAHKEVWDPKHRKHKGSQSLQEKKVYFTLTLLLANLREMSIFEML